MVKAGYPRDDTLADADIAAIRKLLTVGLSAQDYFVSEAMNARVAAERF